MFFWSPEKVEKFVNRIASLIEKDPSFDNMLLEASTEVITVGNAGDMSWRDSIDATLLSLIDEAMGQEDVVSEDSLVGLVFAFKAALGSVDSWPKQLKLRFSSDDGKKSVASYFSELFPKFLVVLKDKAAERRRQVQELLSLYDIEDEE